MALNFTTTKTRRWDTTTFYVVMSLMVRAISQFKILQAIVGFTLVAMMNDLVRFQNSANRFFHNQAMLKNIAFTVFGVVRRINKNVAIVIHHFTAFPFMTQFSSRPVVMSFQPRQGKSKKMSFGADRVFCRFSHLTTTTFTDARRYFFRFWYVNFMRVAAFYYSRVMPLFEARLVVFRTPTIISKFVATPALT